MAHRTHAKSGPSPKMQAGYELGDAPPARPRSDLKLLQRPPRWCPACGCDLTLIDQPPCPRCERPFVPGDKATYSSEPIEIHHPYWTDRQRTAGYVVLPLFLLGRSIINGVVPQWGSMVGGASGTSQAGAAAGVILAVLLALLIIPWFIGTTLLALVAMNDYYNPRVAYCMMIGAGLGLLFAFGMAPAMIFVGIIAGLFAGLLRAWLAKL